MEGLLAPEGLIGLLFTDIEGSTRLAMELGSGWPDVLADHHALVGGSIAAEGGFVDRNEGDAFLVTFSDPGAAARAAVGALRSLREHAWPTEVGELRVRMGLHVGHVERTATGYVGVEVHRAARVAAAAHGGQLLMTASAVEAIGGVLPTESLGLHRLKDFPAPEQLFCAVVDGRGAAAFPPPRTPAFRPNNLPPGAPALVGRELDLVRVRDALLGDRGRLVTLVGAGGVGKTSLALAVGAGLLDEHPGGVWLVNLAPVASSDQVLQEVANAIGSAHDASQSPSDAIVARLRDRGATLVILDNLEQLLSVAPDLARLVDRLPQLRLLITTRTPLRLTSERCLTLDTLDDDAALELIERELTRRGRDVSVVAADRAALLDVVRLLDGLPLALELAAMRLGLLSPGQLRDRLRQSFELLRDSAGDRPARHRSLRAAVDWTLGLLEPQSHALFTRLGVFAGPVEIEEIEVVTAGGGVDVLEALAGLLDVALVRRIESGDGRIRFGFPEALRQIAVSLLEGSREADTWRRAHAERQRQIAWAARATGDAPWTDYSAAVAADAEAAMALDWARSAEDPVGAPLAAARGALLVDLGRVAEAFAVLEPVLRSLTGVAAVDAQTLHSYAYALEVSGRHDEALAAVDGALAIAPDPTTEAKGLMLRGLIRLSRDELHEAVLDSARASELARGVGPALHSGILVMEAQTRMRSGELDRAAAQLAEAERVGAQVDTTRLRGRYGFRAELERLANRPQKALEWLARALDEWQQRGSELHLLTAMESVAELLAGLGRDVELAELLGLIEAQVADVLGPTADPKRTRSRVPELEAAERGLAPATAQHRARGLATPQGMRAARASQLARAPAREGASPPSHATDGPDTVWSR